MSIRIKWQPLCKWRPQPINCTALHSPSAQNKSLYSKSVSMQLSLKTYNEQDCVVIYNGEAFPLAYCQQRICLKYIYIPTMQTRSWDEKKTCNDRVVHLFFPAIYEMQDSYTWCRSLTLNRRCTLTASLQGWYFLISNGKNRAKYWTHFPVAKLSYFPTVAVQFYCQIHHESRKWGRIVALANIQEWKHALGQMEQRWMDGSCSPQWEQTSKDGQDVINM